MMATKRDVVSAPDLPRFGAASWGVLAFALLIVALSLAHSLYRLSLPWDGWGFNSQKRVIDGRGLVIEHQCYNARYQPAGEPSALQRCVQSPDMPHVREASFVVELRRIEKSD